MIQKYCVIIYLLMLSQSKEEVRKLLEGVTDNKLKLLVTLPRDMQDYGEGRRRIMSCSHHSSTICTKLGMRMTRSQAQKELIRRVNHQHLIQHKYITLCLFNINTGK